MFIIMFLMFIIVHLFSIPGDGVEWPRWDGHATSPLGRPRMDDAARHARPAGQPVMLGVGFRDPQDPMVDS
jgi:hypothetical protein